MGFQLPTSTSRQNRTYTMEVGASTLLASFVWRQTNQSSNIQSTVLFQWWQRLAGYGIHIYIYCIHIPFTVHTKHITSIYNQTLKTKKKKKKETKRTPSLVFVVSCWNSPKSMFFSKKNRIFTTGSSEVSHLWNQMKHKTYSREMRDRMTLHGFTPRRLRNLSTPGETAVRMSRPWGEFWRVVIMEIWNLDPSMFKAIRGNREEFESCTFAAIEQPRAIASYKRFDIFSSLRILFPNATSIPKSPAIGRVLKNDPGASDSESIIPVSLPGNHPSWPFVLPGHPVHAFHSHLKHSPSDGQCGRKSWSPGRQVGRGAANFCSQTWHFRV